MAPVFMTLCVICLNHMVQKGPLCAGNLNTISGTVCRETLAKHDILLQYTFITACSDLWSIHQRKCKNGKMNVSIVA
jgi:hypothetical protein